jgi:hypothetical protein
MTIIMFLAATSVRTPIVLWLAAMACDTLMVCSYFISQAMRTTL